MVPGAKILMGVPRSMVSYTAGARPNKNPASRSFLPEGGTFVNFVDNVLCVGTGRGGWVEYEIARIAVVSEDGGSQPSRPTTIIDRLLVADPNEFNLLAYTLIKSARNFLPKSQEGLASGEPYINGTMIDFVP